MGEGYPCGPSDIRRIIRGNQGGNGIQGCGRGEWYHQGLPQTGSIEEDPAGHLLVNLKGVGGGGVSYKMKFVTILRNKS